jgi:hypothetical protein
MVEARVSNWLRSAGRRVARVDVSDSRRVSNSFVEREAGRGQVCSRRVGLGGEQAAERLHGGFRLFGHRRGARVDHRGEGFARGREANGDFFGGERQVFLELVVDADDRGADALGVVDDRLAFGAEFVDETANAQFVVGVAALERVDFGVHERFELGGAGDGALDAFVHRRDLAANGLADGHDALGGDGFRLRQTKATSAMERAALRMS